jgi:hypothetical protein
MKKMELIQEVLFQQVKTKVPAKWNYPDRSLTFIDKI